MGRETAATAWPSVKSSVSRVSPKATPVSGQDKAISQRAPKPITASAVVGTEHHHRFASSRLHDPNGTFAAALWKRLNEPGLLGMARRQVRWPVLVHRSACGTSWIAVHVGPLGLQSCP